MKCKIVPFIVMTFLLSTCSGNEETIKLEDKSFASTLFIQKVEDNSSAEEMTKIVKDEEKIEQILAMIEGLKVEETNNEYALDEMKLQKTYIFNFFEGEKMETAKEVPYAFSVLEDGTFIFTHNDFNSPQVPRITLEKHKELLDDIKQLFEIDF
jgi:hypothetical protein